MNLYTVILDYAGGTHLTQVRAANVAAAFRAWAGEVARGEALELSPAVATELAGGVLEDVAECAPQPVAKLRGVWCVSVLAADKLAVVSVVRTATG